MTVSHEKVACPDGSLALPVAQPLDSPPASGDEQYSKSILAPPSQCTSTCSKSLDSRAQISSPLLWLSPPVLSFFTRLLLFLLYDTWNHFQLTILVHLWLFCLFPRPERFENFLAQQATLHLAMAAANFALRRAGCSYTTYRTLRSP